MLWIIAAASTSGQALNQFDMFSDDTNSHAVVPFGIGPSTTSATTPTNELDFDSFDPKQAIIPFSGICSSIPYYFLF